MARERLGELLLRAGVLTQAQLVTALREQARTGVRLGQILIDHDLVEEVTLYDAIAKVTALERFNLRTAILEKSTLNLVTAEWAFEHGVAPYRIDVHARTVHVAITDPTNIKPVDELGFRLGLRTKAFIASETELQRVLRHHFHGEPLDRDPRNVHRPGGPQKHGEIDPTQIIRGMDSEREEVLSRRPQMVYEQPPQAIIPEALSDTGTMRALPDPLREVLRQSEAARFPEPPRFAEPRSPAPAPTRVPTMEVPTRDLVKEPHDPASPGAAALVDEERAALARLKPIFDTQEEAARALRAIFELCVQKGIIRREEYLERLKRTPD